MDISSIRSKESVHDAIVMVSCENEEIRETLDVSSLLYHRVLSVFAYCVSRAVYKQKSCITNNETSFPPPIPQSMGS